jgi:hypothetical protein
MTMITTARTTKDPKICAAVLITSLIVEDEEPEDEEGT